jgi:hypothetical protein
MGKQVAICSKCVRIREVENHHCLPLRFFSRKNNRSILKLCEDCHKAIELLLPFDVKLTRGQYLDVHKAWLQGKQVAVIFRKEGRQYGGSNTVRVQQM